MISTLLSCLVLAQKPMPRCNLNTVEELFRQMPESKDYRFTYLNHVDQRIVASSFLPNTKVTMADLCLALSLKIRKDEEEKNIIVSPITSMSIESDIRVSIQKFVEVSKRFLQKEPMKMLEEKERVKKLLDSLVENKQTDDEQYRQLSYLQSCYFTFEKSTEIAILNTVAENINLIPQKLSDGGSYLIPVSPSGLQEIDRFMEGKGLYLTHLSHSNLIKQYSSRQEVDLANYQRETIDVDIQYAKSLRGKNLEWFIDASIHQVPDNPEISFVSFQLIPVPLRNNQFTEYQTIGRIGLRLFQQVKQLPIPSLARVTQNGALEIGLAIGNQPINYPFEIFPTANKANKNFAFYFDSFQNSHPFSATIGKFLEATEGYLNLGQTDKWLVMSERIVPATPRFRSGRSWINFLNLIADEKLNNKSWTTTSEDITDKDAMQFLEKGQDCFRIGPQPIQYFIVSNCTSGLVLTKLLSHVRGFDSSKLFTVPSTHSYMDLDSEGRAFVRQIVSQRKVWETCPSILHSSNSGNFSKITFGVEQINSANSTIARLWLKYPLPMGDTARLESKLEFKD